MDISIDIETRSDVDIAKAGAYRYAQSEDFEILLFAYKVNEEPTRVIDLANGEKIPDRILDAMKDWKTHLHAYNAAFEWYCLNRAGYETNLMQWECTMIHGLYCGYPAGLDAIGHAMLLPEDKKKLAAGKALIRYFCKPTGKAKKYRTPSDDPDRWELFKEYNIQDVETEYAVLQRLRAFPMPKEEISNWHSDVIMNATGIRIDMELVAGALSINEDSEYELTRRAKEITELDNPNSNVQLLGWVNRRGVEAPNLQKATVAKLIDSDIPEDVREVLQLRQQMGKTSIKKYGTMEKAVGEEDRVRGLLQFYGANRTGRWAGRLVQVQNLPRNYMSTLDEARRLVKRGDYDGLKVIFGNVPDTLSQLIRTAFVPSPGNKFIVSDFSAIEARVIAWLAGEDWVLDVFRDGGDIYCATASQMFGVPVEKHGVNSDLRQKGKVATLALGYQGGPGALIAMGALDMGIEENELPDIVSKWRTANPHIQQLWWDMENCALHTVDTCETTSPAKGIALRMEQDPIYGTAYFTVQLPSGRKLFYNSPRLQPNRFGKPALHYKGLNQTSKKWEDLETYGGKLTENIVQAIARDCLSVTLNRVRDAGYCPVMHIHDEIVIDALQDKKLEDVNEIFAQPIDWAPGLPLRGDGFEGEYYKKD